MSLNGFSLLPYNDQNPELDCIALRGKGLPPVLPISGQCFPTLALHTGFPAPAPQEPYKCSCLHLHPHFHPEPPISPNLLLVSLRSYSLCHLLGKLSLTSRSRLGPLS